eukprot:3418551-Amphidinium_carterae.1
MSGGVGDRNRWQRLLRPPSNSLPLFQGPPWLRVTVGQKLLASLFPTLPLLHVPASNEEVVGRVALMGKSDEERASEA